ncbi:MAG: helix-turn-helix domain-containing protein [Nanoarchaeota archaeon]
MDIYEQLGEAGLTGNESKVYKELLVRGQSSANRIAKQLSMDRTLSYTVLNHLIEKGLVSYTVKEGKKFFEASNPKNLLNQVKKKELIIGELIKELSKIKKNSNSPLEINVYEGREGLRSWFNFVLDKSKEFLSFGATGKAFYELYEMPALTKNVKKMKLKVRIVGNKEHQKTEAFNVPHVEYRYLDVKSEATTSIFGEYISIHLIKEKPFIILIKNKEIAESYKNYFEVLWSSAKKYKVGKA